MNAPAPLSCRRLVELATDYLDGALPTAEEADLEAHLVICQGCRNYLQQMQRTIGLLGSLAESPAVAPAAREHLLAAFRAGQRGTG